MNAIMVVCVRSVLLVVKLVGRGVVLGVKSLVGCVDGLSIMIVFWLGDLI